MPRRWFLIKDNQRVLRCRNGKGKPCLTRIRVRTPEPGFYQRVCPGCGTEHWFKLEETTQRRDGPDGEMVGLRFHWSTRAEMEAAMDQVPVVDIGIARNQ
jgi:hypothetical protein